MKLYPNTLYSTYSIVARDKETGQLGVAVQTHQMSVGAAVPWLVSGIGALATQSLTNLRYGPMGLAMLREGIPAPKVIEALTASDKQAHFRQVAVVDAKGEVGAWTGANCIAEAGHHIGDGYSVQANMMTNGTVVSAMAEAYEWAHGNLADRMLQALKAAQGEGGDIRGMQSAALKVVKGNEEIFADVPDWMGILDLRVDEHQDPLSELERLLRLANAQHIDDQGHKAAESGDRERATELWRMARAKAPELEEIPFWQAVSLADRFADIQAATELLAPVMANDPRRNHWIDLIRRLQACGLIERAGVAETFIQYLCKV